MNREKLFLLIAAIGLTPVALAYGALPATTMPMLYGVEVDSISAIHIMRAVMGLYLAMVVFWLLGARYESLTSPALFSVVVFMLGLAAGRTVSLLVDGIPSSPLVVYLVLELGFGLTGIYLLRNLKRE